MTNTLPIEQPTPKVSPPLADPRLEAFAQARARGLMLQPAYIAAGYSPLCANEHAWELEYRTGVKRRIQELQRAAAAEVVFEKRDEMLRLLQITQSDISEVVRPVLGPCAFCWDDATMLKALQDFAQDEKSMPDFDKPELQCKRCRGKGTIRTEMADVSLWPPHIRRMLKSVSTDRYGVTTVEFESRQAAGAELAKLAGWIVDKSININANLNIDTAREVTPEEASALIGSL